MVTMLGYTVAAGLPLAVIVAAIWWPYDKDGK